jgi:signal transduction histidine kinase
VGDRGLRTRAARAIARATGDSPRLIGRAASGFGLVTVVTALTAVGSALFARQQSAAREDVLQAYSDDLTHAFQAEIAAEKMVSIGSGYLRSPQPELMARLRDGESDLQDALDALNHPGLSVTERDLLARARRSAGEYQRLFDGVIAAATSEQLPARAAELRERLLPVRAQLGERLEALVAYRRSLQDHARRVAGHMASRAFALMVGLAGLGVALSLLLAYAFTRGLGLIHAREQESLRRAQTEAAAREELVGMVAHDLRNPLSAIAMKAALIQRLSNEPGTRGQAESIANLTGRMSAFIEKLLQAATVDAGRLAVSSRRTAVASVIDATMETFAAIAAEKSVTLAHETARTDLVFWGDPERIAQVLANLVGNAIKFTPAGGTVKMTAVESGFHTRFEVRDTGPGIATQHIPRVFDRFWRADTAGRGTGLGLYIARGIVESHGGRIWVESRVGAGSAFIFELPLASGGAEMTARSIAPASEVEASTPTVHH